ncbi:MAG: thiosulfate sulfurtransferase GlpE [Gammaproteobacteria bacterium]|nr:thiosulfate sulfurtransferase GlpE [Gammaproteobacteria bacterium]MDP2141219.1 thiosulfate sulfurtransferase GlpE [Gammaproteobacteria bacterium]MDP2349107.1 thiosulfate sulfurtransferase GlpE [Gammaproteobacteria bacterium]
MSFIRINAAQARELIAENAIVVDIRDPQSFSVGSIENAVHIDGDNVDEFISSSDLTRPLIVCCYHGNTSQSAAAYFSENGFLQTYSLDGGYEAWQELHEES